MNRFALPWLPAWLGRWFSQRSAVVQAEGPKFNPQNPQKKPGLLAQVCNPWNKEVEMSECLILTDQMLSRIHGPQVSWSKPSCFQNQGGELLRRGIWGWLLASPVPPLCPFRPPHLLALWCQSASSVNSHTLARTLPVTIFWLLGSKNSHCLVSLAHSLETLKSTDPVFAFH